MNCEWVRRTFHFEDDELRPDPWALRGHFANCARCRAEFPEFALLLPTAPVSAPSRFPWRSAAAALLLVTASLGLRDHAPLATHRSRTIESDDPSRPLAYTLIVTTTANDRGRMTSSTLTRRTFRTAPPSR